MDISAAKFSVLDVLKGHLAEANDIKLSSGDLICHLSPTDACKYLGILEANNFKHQQMRELLSVKYKRRVWKLLRTRLFSRNLITAINVLAVSLMRYCGGIIKWSQEELYKLDVSTRKLMTMHGSFSVNIDVDRLYIPRRCGGRVLISVKFAIEHEKRNLSFYAHNSPDELTRLVAKHFEKFQEDGKGYKQTVMLEHLDLLRDKPLHGQFIVRFLTRCVSGHRGCGCRRAILQRSWKALFLQHRTRLYPLILSRLTSTKYHILPSLGCSVWPMKQLII